MLASNVVFRSLSEATQGSAYLLTHLSWTSRMGTGFRKWSFSRPPPPGDDQAGFLEQLQVLHDAETGHREMRPQRAQRLPVLAEELIEKGPPRRIRERLEHPVHERHYK